MRKICDLGGEVRGRGELEWLAVLEGAEDLPGTETLRSGDRFGGFNTFG